MKITKNCALCGKPFTAVTANSKYCSNKCYRTMNREMSASWKKEQVTKPKKRKKDKTIVDLAVEARKAGMTYGQYVAKMEYGMR